MRKVTLFAVLFLQLIFVMGDSKMSSAQTTLTADQAAIIPIAAFTANGDTSSLEKALVAGLDSGLSVNQIKEILVQLYAYAGFPRSLTALATFMNLLKERSREGITDKIGEAPKQLPKDADKNAIGTKIQTDLVRAPVKGELFEFSPAIDAFLKEHLFCDIFSRGVLTNQDRELATIAALAALPAPAQLVAHLNISLNTGITPAQLREYVSILKEKVSEKAAETAQSCLTQVMEKKK